jgi:hypothetical protein
MTAVIRDGKQYFSILNMFKNILGITVFGIVFYFVRDYWLIRYAVFMLTVLLIYIMRGKTIIKEIKGEG